MDPELRARFNAGFRPSLGEAVRRDLARRVGHGVPFPVAETPLFFSAAVRDRFAEAAREVMALLSDPAWIESQEQFVPEPYRSATRNALPQMAQIDFAVARDESGEFVPKCVELQGFPSLYAFQILLADVWATHLAEMPDMPRRWRLFFSDHDRYSALALLRRTIVGTHDPEEVILLDLNPPAQKTAPDFSISRRWWGVDAICLTEIKRDGNKLYRVKDGRTIRIRRIYQRIVMDELEQQPQLRVPFAWHEPLDVEWVPHPAWFFLWSKQSMLHLDHPTIPKTVLLSSLSEWPADLGGWILKPLYSFAGAGVNISPTHADLDAVPADKRAEWVLQEFVEYTDALCTPDGDPVKAELRMMFVRPDDAEELTLLLNLARLSRGKMMGVDFNKDLPWTGSSVGIWAD